MALTQSQLALQMLAQLKILDPSISLEIGTPERKIIDTVAQAISDAQVDLDQLSGSLDLDSKVGSNLDAFLALFGFARQQASSATGFVDFSRTEASTLDITIPVNTQVAAFPDPDSASVDPSTVFFLTTQAVVLPAGQLTITAPIRATVAGSNGNVAAGAITAFSGNSVFGITGVNNSVATTGGTDLETDNALKVRFKNTVFRNLAGTQDQYLALAAATAFTTKANVVGPISRYQEYIQVPPVDDASAYDVNNSGTPITGNGNTGEYTSALSTIPYSKYTYTQVPSYISNGNVGLDSVFFREGIDWTFNTTDRSHGDAFRFYASTPAIGDSPIADNNKPNVTFTHIYTGDDEDVDLISPGDVLLFEHSYMSQASRNDVTHSVTNAVDVYIDGGNNVQATVVFPVPGVFAATLSFSDTTSNKFYVENYIRAGQPDVNPVSGHQYFPLYWQPVVDLPDQITVIGTTGAGEKTAVFDKNTHYWMVQDNTELYGTVRARNGIEWDADLDNDDGIALSDFTDGQITVEGYVFDKNIVDLQAQLEQNKQVTTDVLAHKARPRYLKLDITVIYTTGFSSSSTNLAIQAAVQTFLQGQYFGSVIQLSDILSIIHNATGVDNVRWSSDIPGSTDLKRIVETDEFGVPRTTVDPIDNDFFIKDDELPALPDLALDTDTLPGLIIRTRAQNTWIRA